MWEAEPDSVADTEAVADTIVMTVGDTEADHDIVVVAMAVIDGAEVN